MDKEARNNTAIGNRNFRTFSNDLEYQAQFGVDGISSQDRYSEEN